MAQFRHRSTTYGTQNVLCVELEKKKKNVGTVIPEKKGKAFAVAPNEEIAWNKKKSNATVGL